MIAKFKTYQMSLELIERCQKLKIPAYLRTQLERAALSVALNLSEGNVRISSKDKRRFLMIAYGSIREVQTVLHIAKARQEFDLADQIGACIYTMQRNLGP